MRFGRAWANSRNTMQGPPDRVSLVGDGEHWVVSNQPLYKATQLGHAPQSNKEEGEVACGSLQPHSGRTESENEHLSEGACRTSENSSQRCFVERLVNFVLVWIVEIPTLGQLETRVASATSASVAQPYPNREDVCSVGSLAGYTEFLSKNDGNLE